MTRQELHDALVAEGASLDAFDVLGLDLHPVPGERYLLRALRSGLVGEAGCWAIYYSERGLMSGLRQYASEDEACRAFMAWIGRDENAFDRAA